MRPDGIQCTASEQVVNRVTSNMREHFKTTLDCMAETEPLMSTADASKKMPTTNCLVNIGKSPADCANNCGGNRHLPRF